MWLKVGFEGGGGIDAELNCEKPDGDAIDWRGSNLIGVSDINDAIEGWVLAGSVLEGGGLVLRLSPFSEVYMTATLVDGEFMVPVRDQPIAMSS